jgi:hypothetical protein
MDKKSTLLELCEYFGEHPDHLATVITFLIFAYIFRSKK